jgi:hypothetical protein
MRATSLMVPMALTALCSCSAAPPPGIPVTSASGGVRQLAGEWRGDFWSSETGRHGKIWFHMATGSDSATGQVLMYMSKPSQAVWRSTGTPAETAHPDETQWLSLRFVDVEGGSLSGEIEPYTDPLCSCQVRTSFLGRLEGTRFEGTYTTRGTAREYQSGGRWSAQRK